MGGAVSAENVTVSPDVPLLFLTPRDEVDSPVSNDSDQLVPSAVDDCKSVENMQPSHASVKIEATPRRSARLSVAKQQSRYMHFQILNHVFYFMC